uniref:Ger(x)C family spore germination protein n=1 Tax=Gordoniibacillus kamchatkensis TaxID=1590651 RepID=UPI000A4D66CB|nr:hypothetical protein [Paenibacillus sp. VKM B-2647]
MKGMKITGILIALLVITTGCWNIKEIQNISYATAIGFDYRDGKYIVYLQLIDFSSVAKLEGQQKSREAPVWVGKGTGASFTELQTIYMRRRNKECFGVMFPRSCSTNTF